MCPGRAAAAAHTLASRARTFIESINRVYLLAVLVQVEDNETHGGRCWPLLVGCYKLSRMRACKRFVVLGKNQEWIVDPATKADAPHHLGLVPVRITNRQSTISSLQDKHGGMFTCARHARVRARMHSTAQNQSSKSLKPKEFINTHAIISDAPPFPWGGFLLEQSLDIVYVCIYICVCCTQMHIILTTDMFM